LVSDQNGKSEPNDYVTVSSLDGIGMKADTSQPVVVGKALASFDGRNKISSQVTVKDSAGKDVKVSIGLIPVEVNISRNPLMEVQSVVPGFSFLHAGAQAVTNKDVSPTRLYISVFMLLVIAAISGGILYSGVRSSVMAIGRNPLAKQSIMHGMSQVILIAVIVFIIGVIGVYLILKL
jgi:hypothetical protein